VRACGLLLVLAFVAAGAGCGGTTTDVSKGVASINKDLKPRGARLGCPESVKGGAGAVFACTLTNTRTGKAARLRLKVAKENGQLAVVFVNPKDFPRALKKIGLV
jgi:hypothetical protein